MRNIVWFFVVFFFACVAPDPARYGVKTTATRGCRDPQTTFHRDGVSLMRLYGLADWRPQSDLTQSPDVEVHCDDFTSDCLDFGIRSACGPYAGYYVLGDHEVHVDPARANGYFSFSGVQNHELTHWYIAQGPHPERARLHICPCGAQGADCWTGGCGVGNLMDVEARGLGTPVSTMWEGDVETIDIGELTQNEPTELDRRFVSWAITP